MILREAIRQVRGFRYMIEQLDICSAVGRRVLYDLPWLDSKSRLEAEFERIQKIMVLFEQPENESRLERLTGKLMQVRDIRGTIGRMAMEQVLDDLELFELKTFALCSEEIRGLVEEWRIVLLPELEPVVRLLDPEGNRIPHFYIYDTYSAELARLRAEIKQKSLQGAEERELEALYVQSVVLEDKVREELSVQLRPYHDDLKQALEAVGLLDVVLAKARQAIRGQLTLPQIPEEGEMVFEGLFHPGDFRTGRKSVSGCRFEIGKGNDGDYRSQYGRKDSVVEKCAIGAIPDAVRFLCTCPAGGYAARGTSLDQYRG